MRKRRRIVFPLSAILIIIGLSGLKIAGCMASRKVTATGGETPTVTLEEQGSFQRD